MSKNGLNRIQFILHTKAMSLAIIWTLLIFLACFLPGNELNQVPIPLSDKLAHFLLFAGFSFLWLVAIGRKKLLVYLMVLIAGSILGWLVEEIQGQLYFLGRSKDNMDTLADVIGTVMGLFLYFLYRRCLQPIN